MYYPDLDQRSDVAHAPWVRAIGWLSSEHPYSRGDVTADELARLRAFSAASAASSDALLFFCYMGFHTCEFCGKASGSQNFGVPGNGLLYVAPELVAHYVERHQYQPPGQFLKALLASPLPGTSEYEARVASFRGRCRPW